MQTSIFDDPLKNWNNQDILFDPVERGKLAEANPQLHRVLDWPELRAIFDRHNKLANKAKGLNKRQGFLAITLVGLGVILLGADPIVAAGHSQFFLHTIALAFLSFGGLLGVFDWLVLRARRNWLGHRFWTERLRQLYFQFLLQEHQLASQALNDDEALAKLKTKRANALDCLYREPDDPRPLISEIMEDTCDLSVWVSKNWQGGPSTTKMNPDVELILDALRERRIGVQIEYAQRNLGDDLYSPVLRDKMLKIGTDAALIATLVAALLAWISIGTGIALMRFDGREWLALVGVSSAAVLTLRALREGLKTEEEVHRYSNYKDGVTRARDMFDQGNRSRKLEALAELERLSYVELRSFLLSHQGARFVAF